MEPSKQEDIDLNVSAYALTIGKHIWMFGWLKRINRYQVLKDLGML